MKWLMPVSPERSQRLQRERDDVRQLYQTLSDAKEAADEEGSPPAGFPHCS